MIMDDFVQDLEGSDLVYGELGEMDNLWEETASSPVLEPEVEKIMEILKSSPQPEAAASYDGATAEPSAWIVEGSQQLPVHGADAASTANGEFERKDSIETESSGESASSLVDRDVDGPKRYEGLSAVEIARRKAEDQAKRSIGGKRKSPDADEEPKVKREKVDPNESPEKAQKRRYQRRLQKNRDTAFISRIRRRAYTTLLEEALTESENEKKHLHGSVDSLKMEIATLKAELRGLYAHKMSAVYSARGMQNGAIKGYEAYDHIHRLKGKLFPTSPVAPVETVQAASRSKSSYGGQRLATGRSGGTMLMLSLFFIISIPGLYYSPIESGAGTITTPPLTRSTVAKVWGSSDVRAPLELGSAQEAVVMARTRSIEPAGRPPRRARGGTLRTGANCREDDLNLPVVDHMKHRTSTTLVGH